jgi:hypothetical protein
LLYRDLQLSKYILGSPLLTLLTRRLRACAFVVLLQGYRYFVKPAVKPSSPDSPIMLGFWLGYQAMLSPTFLILSVFFFSFSELFEEVCNSGAYLYGRICIIAVSAYIKAHVLGLYFNFLLVVLSSIPSTSRGYFL